MLFEVLAPALRKHLEELMVHPSFAAIKLPSPWQEVLDGNVANAKHEAVLSVLAARGIEVPDAVRARIVACTDVTTLDRWIRRAATLKTAAAVVREPVTKVPAPRRPSRR